MMGIEEEGVDLEGLDDLGREEDEEGVLDDLKEDEEKVTEGEEEKEKEGEEEIEMGEEEEEVDEEEEEEEEEGRSWRRRWLRQSVLKVGGIPSEKGQVRLEQVMMKVKVKRRQVTLSSGGWWLQPLDPSLAPVQKGQYQIPYQCASRHWS